MMARSRRPHGWIILLVFRVHEHLDALHKMCPCCTQAEHSELQSHLAAVTASRQEAHAETQRMQHETQHLQVHSRCTNVTE